MVPISLMCEAVTCDGLQDVTEKVEAEKQEAREKQILQ